MLDLDAIDVEEIATALADQTDYEHRWLINPRTGEVAFWTSDTGIDGENPVELDELDLVVIDPLPPHVWYQDMVDFADGIRDRSAGERLTRSLEGKGAFRRFKNELYQGHPELISPWHALRDARARVRAVQWLADEGLIEEDAAQQFTRDPLPGITSLGSCLASSTGEGRYARRMADLDAVEARIWALLDRYREDLEDASIYGMPSLRWPGSASHDYFAAVKRSAKKVSLYAIAVEAWPNAFDASSDRFKSRRTGKATFSFPALDDELATELEAFLARLYQEYRTHHAGASKT